MFKRIGRFVKPFVDFRPWLGTERISEDTKTISDAVKTLYDQQKIQSTPTAREDFSALCLRLGLSEHDVKKRQIFYLQTAIACFVCALLALAYAIIMLTHAHSFPAMLISFAIGALLAAVSFRYHFWWYQLKSRRLGTSVHDWFHYGLLGKEKKTHA